MPVCTEPAELNRIWEGVAVSRDEHLVGLSGNLRALSLAGGYHTLLKTTGIIICSWSYTLQKLGLLRPTLRAAVVSFPTLPVPSTQLINSCLSNIHCVLVGPVPDTE